MSFAGFIKKGLPDWKGTASALVSAVLLSLSFPDFGIAPLAFVALVPLLIYLVIGAERVFACFLTGWIFGTAFFFITCYWLTFAPITYAGVPTLLAYLLLLGATSAAGFFSAIAAGGIAIIAKRLGARSLVAAPCLWVFGEFLRYSLTGNIWNSVGYSQAFNFLVEVGAIGGVDLVTFLIVLANACIAGLALYIWTEDRYSHSRRLAMSFASGLGVCALVCLMTFVGSNRYADYGDYSLISKTSEPTAHVVAVQPNVPMSGLNPLKWKELRQRQIDQALGKLEKLDRKGIDVVVVLPESPMNFQYELDAEFRQYINEFATKNNVSVLFNSAEPDRRRKYGFFNSAVLVDSKGKKAGQYDKIHLLPFGEFVPLPEFAQELIPPMVGRFSFGEEYDLLPIGDAKAGIMICFESHFPSLSREFANLGGDVLIEMTNDGYLGPTPVLDQHLASAAFRAVETNRPLLRVTNVGVTAFITENGQVLDRADNYVEDVRVWEVRKAEPGQTVYVRFGYMFPWIISAFSILLIGLSLLGPKGNYEVAETDN